MIMYPPYGERIKLHLVPRTFTLAQARVKVLGTRLDKTYKDIFSCILGFHVTSSVFKIKNYQFF